MTETPRHAATWVSKTQPEHAPPGPWGWLRAFGRGGPLVLLIFGGLALLLVIRVVERPLFGLSRPLSPYVTQMVCRGTLAILGLRCLMVGQPMRHPGAVVANHSSWLDIFALNARKRIYFVSKAEVAGWPGIGWLARATGTVFIERDRVKAVMQLKVFQERLAAGHKLVFFPEGTSTDGRRVLPFKPTLFAAFVSPTQDAALWVQPVTVIYEPPAGVDPRFYGWWGDMDFGPHLLAMLAARRHGSVTVRYHRAVQAADFPDRKALAAHAEARVRLGLTEAGVQEI